MLFSESARQQSIAYGTREGYVNRPIRVDVSNLRICELEFCSTKAVGMNRYVSPRRNFGFEPFRKVHDF